MIILNISSIVGTLPREINLKLLSGVIENGTAGAIAFYHCLYCYFSNLPILCDFLQSSTFVNVLRGAAV